MLFSSWLRNWKGSLERRSALSQIRRPRLPACRFVPRPFLEALEDRTLLASLVSSFAGLAPNQGILYSTVPDPNLAAGPNQILESVNYTLAVYDKATGGSLQTQSLYNFFSPVGVSDAKDNIFDTVVTYDTIANRFVVVSSDMDGFNQRGYLLIAVSNTSNPLDGFTEMHRVDLTNAGGFAGWIDRPVVGWNNDALVISFGKIAFNYSSFQPFVFSIDTSTLVDQNASTFQSFLTEVSDDPLHVATMPGSAPGSPMWFVANGDGSSTVRVVRMDNVLSSTPTFTSTDVTVAPYTQRFSAQQPGGSITPSSGDHVAYENGRLVFADAVGIPSDSDMHVRWYEFNTQGASPTLTQQGTLNPGPGIDTYGPNIALAPNGDIGLTYMESSSTEYLSMYVTGQKFGATPGTMAPGVLVKAGEATYGNENYGSPRTGDFSGIAADPNASYFWATNEYATTTPTNPVGANWGTWMAGFSVGALLVTNTNDSGPGSLRQAILDANTLGTGTAAHPDVIQFAIPTTDPGYDPKTGTFTIKPLSALPALTDTADINGYSQPGASPNTLANGDNAILKIVLDGSQAGPAPGLQITAGSGTSTVRGLAIDHFTYGIVLIGSGNDVAGNFIGTDATGHSAAGNEYGIYFAAGGNTIGGTSPADRNIISGNSWGCYLAAGNGNVLEGNYVGTDVTGASSLENAYGFILSTSNNTIGGTAAGAGNVISGNADDGMYLGGNNNLVQGNLIGTDDTGTTALGEGHGILIDGNNNTIGGTAAGAANVIAFNFLDGVAVSAGTGNSILGNSIFANRGLGIFLNGANNANDNLASPLLTAVSTSTGGTTFTGTLQSVPSTMFRVEFFANAAGNLSGYGAGQTYLGSVNVTTNSTGYAPISFLLTSPIPVGQTIFSATATELSGPGLVPGDTSQFGRDWSAASGGRLTFTVTTTADDLDGFSTADPVGPDGTLSLREAIALVNNDTYDSSSNPDVIAFNITSGLSATGVAAITLGSALPAINRPVVIEGYTQPGGSANTLASGDNAALKIVLDGSQAGSVNGLVIAGGNSTVRGLVIDHFAADGIYLTGNGNDLVAGNFIGTDVTGGSATGNGGSGIFVGSPLDTIGGTSPADRNIISGNGWAGVELFVGNGITGNGSLIVGNYIGTDTSGTTALANGYGVDVEGSSGNAIGESFTTGASNVISGNRFDGILLDNSSNNSIQANLIGEDATGTVALGNLENGINILGSSNNSIGDMGVMSNTIAFNGENGVYVDSGTGNSISRNSIFSNGDLGIRLNFANNANNSQAAPVVTNVSTSNGASIITAKLTSRPNATFYIDFYSTTEPDPSGFGGGRTWLGVVGPVTTNASGFASVSVQFNSALLPVGSFVSATATDAAGDTSEFSRDHVVGSFLVTNTNDSGPGSLRQAITDADTVDTGTAANPDQIQFAIPTTDPGYDPTTGAFFIKPLSALPTITDTLVVDGYSQPGASANTATTGDNAVLKIVLDGSQAGATDGLVLAGGNSTVRGLVIDNFASGSAIVLKIQGNDLVAGNFIGTDITGESAAANHVGIVTNPDEPILSIGNTIGGAASADRNIISGNSDFGIDIDNENLIEGNYVGTDKNGTYAIGNGTGIIVGSNNTIGGSTATLGAGPGNLISGNTGIGIDGANQNLIAGNLIGTDVTGRAALGNGFGITVGGNNNTIGGITAAARNIVSGSNGNDGSGIIIDGEFGGGNYNTVEGNYVGTDITGTQRLANDFIGVWVSGSFNTIGGTTAGARNIVSGNGWENMTIVGPGNYTDPNVSSLIPTGNTVEGNYLGTDVTGTQVLGNPRFGIEVGNGAYNNTIGGLTSTPGTGPGNLISGDTLGGIELDNSSRNNVVQGNLIGTDKTDTTVLGAGDGIIFYLSNDNTIGGTVAGAGNIIRDCSNYGVEVEAGTGNAILGNSIYANSGRGIQLDPQFSASGGNDNQAAPVLTAATLSSTSTTISGTLAAAPNTTFRIEFFSNQAPSPSGEDGQTYLGYTQVTTDGNGNANFTAAGLAPAPAGQVYLTATATVTNSDGTFGDTSGFSPDTSLLSIKANSLAASGSNGAVVSNSGTFSDGITGSTVTLSASVGTVTQNGNTWSWSETTPSGAAQTAPVTIYATDSKGQTAAAEFWLNVSQVFVVTNTGDNGGVDPTPGAGTGTLRQAIVDANNASTGIKPSLIAFDIASSGMQTIYLDAALPTINNPAILDGMTEPGSQANSLPVQGATAGDNGAWAVTLDGSAFGGGADGLVIAAGSSTVQGLLIQSFANGIHLTTNGNDTIDGNYLPWPLNTAIFIDNVPNNTIGGTNPAARNVIGGGSSFLTNGAGVAIEGAGATGNEAEGNYVGFDGTRPLYSPYGGGAYSFYDQTGVLIQDASDNVVGGTASGAGNVIAAAGDGVSIVGASEPTSGNLVQGNYIGVNPAGVSFTIPASGGVSIRGVASNNTIGGATASARNVIGLGGVFIAGFSPLDPTPQTGNTVENNYIGTNAAGTAALLPGEQGTGVTIRGYESGTIISSNLISGFAEAIIDGGLPTQTEIQGNLIGTDATGTKPIPNGVGIDADGNNSQIGGTGPGEGNVIAFNDGPAVYVAGTGDAIEGNSIYGNGGINGHTGQPIDNLNQDGDSLSTLFEQNWPGGPFAGTDNAYFTGLMVSQTGSTLNYVGTLNGLPNTRYLVTLAAISNGGKYGRYWGSYYTYQTTDSSGTVSFTVSFQAPWGTSNTPRTPSASEWVAHSLGNYEQNYPVLTSATSGTSTVVSGTLNAQPNTTFTVDVYANPTVQASDYYQGQYYGQGQYYLGHVSVTTDASGNASFTADFSAANLPGGTLPNGWYISATATDPGGNTSQFSADVITAAPTQSFSQYLQSVLPTTQNPTAPTAISIQTGPDLSQATVISAVNGLSAPSVPVTITLNLNGGTYNDTTVSPPQNITLVINGASGTNTFVGQSPAFTVTGGNVIVTNVTFTTATDAPTILVTGGNLTLLDDGIIQASTIYTDPAIAVTGGTVNLGTATSPGNNTLSVSNSGDLVSNTTGNPISAVGDTFVVGGTVETATSLSFTSLATTGANSSFGQSVTFTATVASNIQGSATPTGNVDFYDSTTGSDLGTVALSSGMASLSTSGLGAGTHVIQARYGGDSNFLPSLDSLTQIVNQDTTSTSLRSSANPSLYGQSVIITATVAAGPPGSGTPTGSVDFTDITTGQDLGTASLQLVNGVAQASLTLSSLSANSHVIEAAYTSDNSSAFANSSSPTLTQVVNKATPTVSVSDAGGTYNGNSFPAKAIAVGVDGKTAVSGSFTYTYYAGTGTSGTSLGANAPINAGTYTVVASFTSGDSNYSNNSAQTTFTINPRAVTLSGSRTYDGTTTAAANILSITNLTGSDNVTLSGSATLASANAGLETISSFAGLSLGGSAATNYTLIGASGSVNITPATPKANVTDAGGTYNQSPFAATATVTGVNGITGSSLEGVTPTLTYYSGSTPSGTPLSGAPFLPGTYTVLASFAGSADYNAASATTTFTISTPTTSITGPTVGVPGQPLTDAFAVNGPTQAIVFNINYGDGTSLTTAAGGSNIKLDHLYTATGSFTIQVTATDKYGVVSQLATQKVTISTVAMETDPSGGTALAVGGNAAGGDTITVSAVDTTGKKVDATINKTDYGMFTPTGHIFVYGQGGKDKITLNPYVVGNNTYYYIQVAAFLYGEGSGGDKISAAGSAANNVLTGHGNNEALTGGQGRDLLIAGTGSATLNAGRADDILIGGWTNYDLYNMTGLNTAMTYDQKVTALEAIMAEWGSADSYATRISDLTNGGGLNGAYLLSGSASPSPTVHAGGADVLNGVQTNQSSALDWFMISALDSVNYFNKKTETETPIS